jgi:hypothetical protein
MFPLLAALVAAQPAQAPPPLDPLTRLIVHWPAPDARAAALLRDLGAGAVLTPPAPRKPETGGLILLADIPAADSTAALDAAIAEARAAGYDSAAVRPAGAEPAFRKWLAAQQGFVQLVYLKPEQIAWDVSPALAVFEGGRWPGLQGAGVESAGATERPWINSNLYIYSSLNGRFPARPAVLACRPENEDAPYESLEIALAESFAGGGAVILPVPGMFREALLRGDSRAMTAWKSLAQTAAFVGARRDLSATTGSSTAIVADGSETVDEFLNLAWRNNLAPRVFAPAGIPPLAGLGLRLVSATNIALQPAAARRLLEFAAAGGQVIAAPPEGAPRVAWLPSSGLRKVAQRKAWTEYGLGRGTIFAYSETVFDPSEFALDLREFSGINNPARRGLHGLDFRIWNAATILGAMCRRAPGERILIFTSYGGWRERDFLAGVRGDYASASLLTPGAASAEPIVLMKRTGRVEFNVKGMGRLGVVILRERGR